LAIGDVAEALEAGRGENTGVRTRRPSLDRAGSDRPTITGRPVEQGNRRHQAYEQ
jgi:hypothetical protein